MQSELLHKRESTTFFCILSSLEPEAVSAAAVCNAGGAHLKSHSLVACQVASVLVQIFVTLWTVTHQASLPMGFSRQEYWSRLPFLPPGDHPHPGINSCPLVSCTGLMRSFVAEPPGKPQALSTDTEIWISYDFSCIMKYSFDLFSLLYKCKKHPILVSDNVRVWAGLCPQVIDC